MYKIKKSNLMNSLNKISTVSGNKLIAIKPTLVEGNFMLKFTASNDRMQIENYCTCETDEKESKKTFFVSTKFANICKYMEDKEITITLKGNQLSIKGKEANISLPLQDNGNMLVADVNEHPEEHPLKKAFVQRFKVNTQDFTTALEVYGAMNVKDIDNAFNKILLTFIPNEKKIEIASMDGYSFCVGETSYLEYTGKDKLTCSIGQELVKAIYACSSGEDTEEMLLTYLDNMYYVYVNNTFMYFRLNESGLKDTAQLKGILEAPEMCKCKVHTKEFLNGINLIEEVTNDDDKSNSVTPITMSFGEKLKLLSPDGSLGEFKMECKCEGEGTFCFSSKLLKKVANLMPSETDIVIRDVNGHGYATFRNFACILPINNK